MSAEKDNRLPEGWKDIFRAGDDLNRIHNEAALNSVREWMQSVEDRLEEASRMPGFGEY